LMLRPAGLALRELMLRPAGLALRELMLRPAGLALRAPGSFLLIVSPYWAHIRSAHSDFAQILVDELHGHRSFTYSGRHSFDRAVPHIAYGEYTGNVGFQQERISFK